MRRELRELKGDEQAYALYVDGISKLRASGYLNALRALARPNRHNQGKDPNQMASEAAWSAGANDVLDWLQHFKEFFLSDEPAGKASPVTFGAVELAQSRGDITKEEADARTNSGEYKQPNIASVTGNLKRPESKPTT